MLDPSALGITSVDTEGTYVGSPVAFDAFPPMVSLGETMQKAVRLSNI